MDNEGQMAETRQYTIALDEDQFKRFWAAVATSGITPNQFAIHCLHRGLSQPFGGFYANLELEAFSYHVLLEADDELALMTYASRYGVDYDSLMLGHLIIVEIDRLRDEAPPPAH